MVIVVVIQYSLLHKEACHERAALTGAQSPPHTHRPRAAERPLIAVSGKPSSPLPPGDPKVLQPLHRKQSVPELEVGGRVASAESPTERATLRCLEVCVTVPAPPCARARVPAGDRGWQQAPGWCACAGVMESGVPAGRGEGGQGAGRWPAVGLPTDQPGLQAPCARHHSIQLYPGNANSKFRLFRVSRV